MHNPYVFFLLSILLVACAPGFSQTYVCLTGGQTISQFRFVDANGKVDSNHKSVTGGTYHLGLDHYTGDKLYISTALGYKKTGSSTEIDRTAIVYNLDYVDLQVKGGLTFFRGRPYQQTMLSPFVELGIYGAIALKGTQMVGDSYYDMLQQKAIKKTDGGVMGGAGLVFRPAKGLRIRVGGFYHRGIFSIENSSEQKTFNKVISIEAGLLLNLQMR